MAGTSPAMTVGQIERQGGALARKPYSTVSLTSMLLRVALE
jgi:hypothetical protein